jgi:hypothetical protein
MSEENDSFMLENATGNQFPVHILLNLLVYPRKAVIKQI